MDQITIKKSTTDDVPALQQIGRETFYETFANGNTREDMQQYLDANFSADKVHGEVGNPESEFYIAYSVTEVIGYLKLNTGNAQTELNDPSSIEIERIYVSGAWHGKKVGQLLYNKALEVATAKNMSSIWLGVWEENPRAIRFYEKNGFVAFDKHIFKVGDDEQTDIMMRKVI